MYHIKNKIDINRNRIDIIIYSIIILIFSVDYLVSFNFNKNIFIQLSFAIIGILSFVGYVSDKRVYSINVFIFLFLFVFGFVAPYKQYLSGNNLWGVIDNTDQLYLITNMYIILFIILYMFYRNIIFRKISLYKIQKNKKAEMLSTRLITNRTLYLLSILNIIAFLIMYEKKWIGFSKTTTSVWSGETFDIFFRVVISSICVTNLIYVVLLKKNNRVYAGKRAQYVFNIISFVCIFIVYFPLWGNMPRYLLFSIYIMICIVFFDKFKYKSIILLITLLGLCYIFPAFNFFKYNNISNISEFAFAKTNFNHYDYDSHQVFMITIYYVNTYGIVYGKNIISAILCFIPRIIWPSKFLPSGQYIFQTFNAPFTNVSCPIYAEFYLAFGPIGIVILTFLYTYIIQYFELGFKRNSFYIKGLCIIVMGLVIYVLRGSLLPATSSMLGVMVAYTITYIMGK